MLVVVMGRADPDEKASNELCICRMARPPSSFRGLNIIPLKIVLEAFAIGEQFGLCVG